MIVSLHVATGAAGGAAVGSWRGALLLGPVLHLLGDRIPHRDIHDRDFEAWSGIVLVVVLAGLRGPTDPATIGAVTASAPDLEHVLRLPRPGGRKLFPSHRVRGWHRSGGISPTLQLLAAGLLAGAVLSSRRLR